MTDHSLPESTIAKLPDERDGMLMLTPEQASLFSEPTRNDIMTLLAERPATTKELAEALEKPKGTVGHHLKALEEAGLIAVVRTRKVRAITEKYYGRVARTYVFPRLDETADVHPFMAEAIGEMREPTDDEEAFFTIRRARIPADRVRDFALALVDLAEEFVEEPKGGNTVYGLIAGIYPTDRPTLGQAPLDEEDDQ